MTSESRHDRISERFARMLPWRVCFFAAARVMGEVREMVPVGPGGEPVEAPNPGLSSPEATLHAYVWKHLESEGIFDAARFLKLNWFMDMATRPWAHRQPRKPS